MPVVLCGCDTWLFTLREERRLRVFENRLLRRIFVSMRDEVTREWRKLYNEELNDVYFSPNIFGVRKWRRMRWAGHVERLRERRRVYRVFLKILRQRDHLGDPGLDESIIVRWIFRKWDVGVWTGSSWLRIGLGGGHL